MPVCAAIEAEISSSTKATVYSSRTSASAKPCLNRVIRAGYKLLGLQTYFTAGVKEVRAWTVRVGATAPQAAGVIHTDFERGFIRPRRLPATTIAGRGEAGAREAGRLWLEGRLRRPRGDVMHFRFNV